MDTKKTLVLGASDNPERYSNMAVKKLSAHQHPIIALGNRPGLIGNHVIQTEKKPFEGVHTVTLYLNALHQQQYYDYIFSLQPKRIIFNPGAENDDLYEAAKQRGIEVQEACTLVLLSTGQY